MAAKTNGLACHAGKDKIPARRRRIKETKRVQTEDIDMDDTGKNQIPVRRRWKKETNEVQISNNWQPNCVLRVGEAELIIKQNSKGGDLIGFKQINGAGGS